MSDRGWEECPKIWEGGTAYIIGGGPSVNDMNLSLIHDKRVIGVNDSFLLGDWVDVCWWGDDRWFDWNRKKLLHFAGLKVHCSSRHRKALGNKYMERSGHKSFGISRKPGIVVWNLNSGMSAINLAYHFGVKRIVLIGFEMHVTEDGSGNNWHTNHEEQGYTPRKSFERFLDGPPHVAKDARDIGIEIVNATPGTSIDAKHFPHVRLEDTVNGKW